jgi:hypothetical protein
MMKSIAIGIFMVSLLLSHSSHSQKFNKVFFKRANAFFDEYVLDGQVDYKKIIRDKSSLEELVGLISNYDIQSKADNVRKAFYINAYNILIINNVIKNFPVPYPIEEVGFFSKVKHKVANDSLTLNEIETLKLIQDFKDVRILFAISAGTKGSLPVADYAYKPKKLNRQFKKRIKQTVNDFAFIRVMPKSSKILLAEAFIKSQSHFNKQDILDYINEYRECPLPKDYSIEFYPANRKLNMSN